MADTDGIDENVNYQTSLNVTKALAPVSTIFKCGEAAVLDMFFHDRLKAVVIDENHNEGKKSPPLLVGEKQLLTLAVYEECSDAIFYVMPVIIEVNGENNLFLRYFEAGKCKGFLAQNLDVLVKDFIETFNIKETHSVPIFNAWDIDAYRLLKSSSKKG
uniref:Uncharacterized protein n=1 Tax=Clytia hemisphaerica TaxID=252671 RepID=A0A7M5WWV1_9CNID